MSLRPLSGYEEEYVEECKYAANTAKLCNGVLARCLVAPGADSAEALARVHDLPVAERDRALIELRRLSFGDDVRTLAECPHCDVQQEVAFTLAALPLDFDTPPTRIERMLSTGVSVVLRLPTARCQEELLDEPDATAAQRRTALLTKVIEQLGGQMGPFDGEHIRGLESKVRMEIEKCIEETLPELNLTMEVTCVQCARPFAAPFDVTSFFLPS
ncbi:MAG: hypothetical protein JST91_12695 [Actinobacteria bacterium]|nr:hypothetical protein [Actinomycetota bacterium]